MQPQQLVVSFVRSELMVVPSVQPQRLKVASVQLQQLEVPLVRSELMVVASV